MRHLLHSLLTLFLVNLSPLSAQFSAENAAFSALGTDAAMLAPPSIYGFDSVSYTPVHVNNFFNPNAYSPNSEDNLTTATLINASAATSTTLSPGDFKYIYYDGVDYKGNNTRVFSVVKIPASASNTNKVPAIILVHGGGGSAYVQWVDLWASRGYAAISIAVEGQTNRKDSSFTTIGTGWNSHDMAGPTNTPIYADTKSTGALYESVFEDQWMYHAVADTVLANSLMRSLSFVDENKVGVTGVSWGGVITSTVIGVDNRFAFAIPTYGCGHKWDSSNGYGNSTVDNDLYRNVYDPHLRLAGATVPTLWYSYSQETNFSLDSHAKSYHESGGVKVASYPVNMNHGHNSTWSRLEPYYFADSITQTGSPWAQQLSHARTANNVTVTYQSTKPLTLATMVTTPDYDVVTTNVSMNQVWTDTPLATPVDNGNGTYTVTATLPADTKSYIINAYHDTGETPNENGNNGNAGQPTPTPTLRKYITVSSDYKEIIEVTPSPATELAITHPLCDSTSTGIVELTYDYPHNIEVSSITFTGASHAGAFSLLSPTVPYVEKRDPDDAGTKTDLEVQFDNSVAGLTGGQVSTATLVIEWVNLDGSTDQVTVPVKATVSLSGGGTIAYGASADWSSQVVSCCDDVVIDNNATVNVDGTLSPTELVTNGSFEAPNVVANNDASASGFQQATAGSSTLTGWSIANTGVFVIDGFDNFGNEWQHAVAADGDQFVQLQSTSGTAIISQDIVTVPGETYLLTFDYGGLSNATRSDILTYTVDGVSTVKAVSLASFQSNPNTWQTESTTFTASSALTTISFTGEFTAGFYGPAVDNVSVREMSSSICVDEITVNDDAAPITGTLDITQDVDVSVKTAFTLGTGTGVGTVNQADGSVDTPILTINSNNSSYHLTGGDLNLPAASGILDVRAGGELCVDGGTVSMDVTGIGNSNQALGSTSSTGKIKVNAGAFQFTGASAPDITFQWGTMEISGGDIDIIAQHRVYNEFKVIGDAASINIGWLNAQNGSDFVFEMGATGVSPISVNSWMSLGNAALSVDGASFTGGAGTYPLLTSTNLLAQIPTANISLTNFPASLVATIVQDAATDQVNLVLTSATSPYDSWAASFGVSNANAATADADGDGYPNLYEYAFGGDPTSQDSIPAPSCFDGDTFTITRREGAAAELIYTLQESTTLDTADWDDLLSSTFTEMVTGTSGDYETVEITPVSAGLWGGTETEFFLRMKVEQAP